MDITSQGLQWHHMSTMISQITGNYSTTTKTPRAPHSFPYVWVMHLTDGIPSQNASDQYNDVIMGAIASQITGLMIVYSIIYSDADQRKRQSSTSLAFVQGIHRWPVNSPHKWPVTRKMFPFDDVIMYGKQCHAMMLSWMNQRRYTNSI